PGAGRADWRARVAPAAPWPTAIGLGVSRRWHDGRSEVARVGPPFYLGERIRERHTRHGIRRRLSVLGKRARVTGDANRALGLAIRTFHLVPRHGPVLPKPIERSQPQIFLGEAWTTAFPMQRPAADGHRLRLSIQHELIVDIVARPGILVV